MMTADELAVVLLELARTSRPEKWIAQWQPELVDSLETVIQWALGRIPADIARKLPEGRLPEELSRAALVLVKQVCFAEGANCYQIFGLKRGPISQEVLRIRYRALIRLTHPDVGVKGLPADAASLVNRAYAVLGDESARKAYDDQLTTETRERVQPAYQSSRSGDAHAAGGGRGGNVTRRSVAHKANMGERMLARWVRVNARWSRQLHVSLIGIVLMIPLGLFFLWDLSDTQERHTIVALAPDASELDATLAATREQNAAQDLGLVSSGGEPVSADASGGHAEEMGDLNQRDLLRSGWDGGQDVDLGRSRESTWTDIGDGDIREREVPEMMGAGSAEAMVAETTEQTEYASFAAEDLPQQDIATTQAPDAMTGAAKEFQVDWPAARRYLQDIASAMEDRSEAQWMNHYLEQMNVRGSLLRPIMALYEQYGSLSARYSTWSMAEGHGLFDAETMLTVQARSGSGKQPVQSFLLRAQFQAEEGGTKLKVLDLLPVE